MLKNLVSSLVIWVGEEEWGDEEEENVALVEEEVPNFVDNGDGTISDTQSNLMISGEKNLESNRASECFSNS